MALCSEACASGSGGESSGSEVSCANTGDHSDLITAEAVFLELGR